MRGVASQIRSVPSIYVQRRRRPPGLKQAARAGAGRLSNTRPLRASQIRTVPSSSGRRYAASRETVYSLDLFNHCGPAPVPIHHLRHAVQSVESNRGSALSAELRWLAGNRRYPDSLSTGPPNHALPMPRYKLHTLLILLAALPPLLAVCLWK